jgi:PPM family protein phosphatase
MTQLRHIMIGLSDPGRVRAENEDCIRTRPDLGMAVLADGMGGHQAGEVASGMAVDIVTQYFESAQWNHGDGRKPGTETQALAEAIQQANNAIYAAAKDNAERQGMGSTLVMAVFCDDRICIGHVGDSRLYRLREQTLEQLTQDHSVVQELINRGIFTREEARQSLAKNLVTRALGVDPNIEPEVSEQPVRDGDVYLLCSDGLNDILTDEQIADVMRRNGDKLNQAARELIDLANAQGGPDNVSAILIRASSDPLRPEELDEI